MSRVLVVDDEAGIRLLARVILSNAGHEVVEAASGEAALALVDAGPTPDVVLLDLRLRRMDGWEVLSRLKDDPNLKGLPVVVFTAHLWARSDAPPEWRDYQHFITKPFKPAELVGAVESALADAPRIAD